MNRQASCLATLSLLLLTACRTSAPEGNQPAPGQGAPHTTEPVTVAPHGAELPDLTEDRTPSPVLAGFDQNGAVTCLAMAEGGHCLTRKDAFADACAAAKGQALHCEDCSVLCSKDIKAKERR